MRIEGDEGDNPDSQNASRIASFFVPLPIYVNFMVAGDQKRGVNRPEELNQQEGYGSDIGTFFFLLEDEICSEPEPITLAVPQ